MYCFIYSEAIANYNLSLYTFKKKQQQQLKDRSVCASPKLVIFHYDLCLADYISVLPLTVKHLDARMFKELTAGFKLYPHLFKLFISLTNSFPIDSDCVILCVCFCVLFSTLLK